MSRFLDKSEDGKRILLHRARKLSRTLEHRRRVTRELTEFISSFAPGFRKRLLLNLDPARVFCLMDFCRFLKKSDLKPLRVAVVSGSPTEPELLLLDQGFELTQLNFQDNPELWDLGKDWASEAWTGHHGAYDLVLCEQVLEHVVDPQLAFRNLSKLLAPAGVLHVGVPSVNNRHGDPYYFYSGFALETLHHLSDKAGLSVIGGSAWESDKASRMYSTSDWSPLAESGPVSIFYLTCKTLGWRPKQIMRVLWRRVRNFCRYPFQPLISRPQCKNAVTSWVFATLR